MIFIRSKPERSQVGGRGFPEPVKVMLLAYRASLARYLDFMAVVVPSFAYGNFAPPAVETGSLGDCLELFEESDLPAYHLQS